MKAAYRLLFATSLLSAGSASATCWDEASVEYGIPANVLKAIAKVESNFNPKAVRKPYVAGNKDGSYDIGLVQINSSHFPKLEREFGITENQLYDGCTNLKVGAWILADNVRRLGWNWNAIGAYNAGCARITKELCTKLRLTYANKVYAALQRLDSGAVVATLSSPRQSSYGNPGAPLHYADAGLSVSSRAPVFVSIDLLSANRGTAAQVSYFSDAL
mgnify:CR=1 FL=1